MQPSMQMMGNSTPTCLDQVQHHLFNMSTTLKSSAQRNLEKLSLLGTTLANHLRNLKFEFEVDDWCSVEGMLYMTLLVVVVFSSLLIIAMNIYRKIRYAIPARVNCWFCNTNTKVLYSLRDTWTCPNCHQYNGFTADGNYNKRIPAQFIEALNRPVRGAPARGYHPRMSCFNSNGMCSQCNLNQVLKVFQLSHFVPVNEKHFDVEIEAEQKRLEQVYDICPQCKIVVQETLKRTPDKPQQLPVKRKPRNTSVFANSYYSSAARIWLTCRPPVTSRSQTDEDDFLKDVSDISECDYDGDVFLSLNKLKIY